MYFRPETTRLHKVPCGLKDHCTHLIHSYLFHFLYMYNNIFVLETQHNKSNIFSA